MELCRVVESLTRLYAEQATTSYEKALYLESVLERNKPPLLYPEWNPLIATPFRYPLPVAPAYQARFRPPFFEKNVLYASRELRTCLYEHAYHFLFERHHLKAIRESGQRNAFILFLNTTPTDIHHHPDLRAIMNRHDYAPSHAYIRKNPVTDSLLYPSCRDPQQGDNVAIFTIECLAKNIGTEKTLFYYFDPKQLSIAWMDFNLTIAWKEVS